MAKTYNHLDQVKSLLNEAFLEKGSDSEFLKEKKLMSRKIVCHTGIDYLLYRYDPDKTTLFPYFSEHSNLRKICDYILFASEGRHLHLLLIELKFGTESATKQLIASECFVEFVLNSAKRVGIELTSDIYIKKIRVSEERAKKRNRRTKHMPLEYDENNVINYDHSDVFRIREVISI